MKKAISLTTMAIVTIFILFAGCKKDSEDEKVLNKVTIAGNDVTEYNMDYIPEEGFYIPASQADCNTTLYRSEVWIDFTSGASVWMRFFNPETSVGVPTGTFNLTTDCVEGFVASFYVNAARKVAGVCFSTGTITIAKTDDTYDVDIDLTIDPECGGGTMKGNFSGTLSMGVTR